MTQPHLCLELTAPGKIILFGEHSVVYGKKAIAATLGLYTKLRLTENNTNSVTLLFPPIDLEETYPLNILREYFHVEKEIPEKERVQLSIEAFDKFYSIHGKKSLNEGQRYALIAFFHSFADASSGFTLHVDTDLPISSGAGSSASYSVVVTTAAVLFNLIKSGKLSEFVISENGSHTLTDKLKDIISERAYMCECLFHGTPSGIDNSVILHGSALEFVKSDGGNKLTPINAGTVKVILVNTKVPRSTKNQVHIFRSWKEKFPDAVERILDAMGAIAGDGVETLRNLRTESESELEKNEARLAGLVDLNHGLLRALGVSHDSLEKICSIAKSHGLCAKLTGAGGGGLGFVYVPSKTSSSTISNLKQELEQAGFEASEVILGGPGLGIKSLSLS